MLRYCKNCGLLLPHDADRCPQCGAPAPLAVRPAAQPGPAAPLYGAPDDREAEPMAEAMSQGATTGTMILFAIPVVAFIMAAKLAYKAAIPEAGPVLLEPIGTLKAHVPADNTGDIMGEVTKRRGRVLGMNPDDDGLQVVEAEVPMAEMQDFTTFLRQLTQGRGYYTFEFVRYETLPQMLESKVIEKAKALGNFADED